VNLVAGGKYRFEVYGINNVESGHFSLGVIVPNGTPAVNNSPHVLNIKISYNPIREKIIIASSLTSGTFNFGFQDTVAASNNYTPRSNIKTFKWDDSCDTITAGVRYNSLNLACVRTANGSGFIWTITVNEYRTDFKTMIPKATGASVTVEPSSDPIEGTYKISYQTSTGLKYLLVNGKEDISYNANAWDLNWALKSALNLETVFDWQYGKAYDGLDHYVQLYTESQALPVFTPVFAGTLTGKAAKVEVIAVRQANTNIELNSIPHEFLQFESTLPAILVTVNGVLGTCTAADCSYVANTAANGKTFTITNWNAGTSKLQIALVGLTSTEVKAEMLEIRFGNSNCIKPTITVSAVECTIEINEDGVRLIEGGNNTPVVNIV
jgi:hypothetical protein